MGQHYAVKYPGEKRKCSGADKCSVAENCTHSKVHYRQGICHYPCQNDKGIKGATCKTIAYREEG